jgi:hypothetical protein
MGRHTWEELASQVAFPVLVPHLPEGWEARPGAMAPGVVVVNVYNPGGTLQYNLTQTDGGSETEGREQQDVDGQTSYWIIHFAERNPVTNVIANIGTVQVAAAGNLSPEELGRAIASLRPKT